MVELYLNYETGFQIIKDCRNNKNHKFLFNNYENKESGHVSYVYGCTKQNKIKQNCNLLVS